MNKPILFIDFYKTINHDTFWRGTSPEQCEKIQELIFKNTPDITNDWMRGKYTSEEMNRIISKKFNIPYEKLWQIFVEDCKATKISKKILESINSLRKKYLLVLITDNMDSFTRFVLPALKLENYFDIISNSFEQGLLKTDNQGELFLKYVKLQNADIQYCICLDDSQSVFETFTKLGGTAYLVTPEQDVLYHLEKLAQ